MRSLGRFLLLAIGGALVALLLLPRVLDRTEAGSMAQPSVTDEHPSDPAGLPVEKLAAVRPTTERTAMPRPETPPIPVEPRIDPAPPPTEDSILLSGRVVDDRGDPVAKPKVFLHVRGGREGRGRFQGRGDEAGRFTIHGTAPPGAKLLVDLLCAGYRNDGFLTEVPGRGDAVLVMNREGVIRGRIVAEPGAPLSLVRVEAEREGANDLAPTGSLVRKDGTFEISRLLPARYTVRGRIDLFEDPLFEVEGIEVEVGEVVEDVSLAALALPGPLHLFKVQVENPEGRRLREATARRPEELRLARGQATVWGDLNGILRIASPDSALEVEIGADDRQSVRVRLTSPEQTVVLPPPLDLLLVVPDLTSLPRDRVRISLGLHDPARRELKSYRGLNGKGELRLRYPTTGPREVGFRVSTGEEGSFRNSREVPVTDPEVIRILDTDSEQRFILALPPEVVEAASRR